MTGTVALEVAELAKSFGGQEVLHGVDLSVAAGTITAVVGASGCGKTTLLRLVAGFETPDRGTVSIAGRQVASAGGCTPAHRRDVGYVAQDGALFPHLYSDLPFDAVRSVVALPLGADGRHVFPPEIAEADS